MAFSFAELLKKQFPMAELGVDTRGSKRMPESNPFPSTSALGALGMGGALDALGGVSMADYFNNDNWETRQVEGVSKRGDMVDRQYRMNPGDKTTIKVGNDGKIVETTERTTGDLFSEQPNRSDYPVQVSLPSQRGSEFDPRMSGDLFSQQPVIDPIQSFEGGRMPTNTVYPRPITRSMYNRPAPLNEPDVYSTNPSYQGGMGGQGYIASGRMPTNTVYPRPTTRSMYNRPVINSLLAPELGDTAQSEMNRLPMLINQGEDGVFPPTGPNVYGLDEGMFNEDPDDERRRLLGELLRQYYQTNPRTYTSSI